MWLIHLGLYFFLLRMNDRLRGAGRLPQYNLRVFLGISLPKTYYKYYFI